jgi:hypothetical protein
MAFAREYGGGSGSKNAMMALRAVSKKRVFCRGKGCRVRDPRPLGAAMGSPAFFPGGHKYCHNGGMAFASSTPVA